MERFKKSLAKIIKDFWPIAPITLLVIVFFWKFFLKGLLPIPADIIADMYFPWLDYKWGYIVGVPVRNSLISDVVSQVYPWRISAIEILKQKQIPLWNGESDWKAFVDDKETSIYRANSAFRAVFVPKGKHTIRFIYDPQSFKIGAVVSLMSLVILGGFFLYETKNRRRASPKRTPRLVC